MPCKFLRNDVLKNANKEKTEKQHLRGASFFFNLTSLLKLHGFNVFSSILLPMTAKVPSRIPTADWIVGMPCNCLTGILQFPLTLQGHTVTKAGREERMHTGKFIQGVLKCCPGSRNYSMVINRVCLIRSYKCMQKDNPFYLLIKLYNNNSTLKTETDKRKYCTKWSGNTANTSHRGLHPYPNEPNQVLSWSSKDFWAVVTFSVPVNAATIGCARPTRVFGNRWFLSSASRVCMFNVNRLFWCFPAEVLWSIAEPPLKSSARTSWHIGFDVYWSLLFPCPIAFLCMIWPQIGRIVVTWQVYEGAPGRRAAVRDGEGHSVDLRGQVWDI